MKIQRPLACALVILASSPVFAQPQPLSLCIVDTKPNTATRYQPDAGPYAIAIYDQLKKQKLQNGRELRMAGLAASVQGDILPEVHRLNCSWVLQLWYHRSADGGGGTDPTFMGDQDVLLFTLWNRDTQKVIARGSGIAMRETIGSTSLVPNPLLYSGLARQIMKKLDQLP